MRLSYLAPSDCPPVDGYLSHVRARSTSLELQERGVAAGDSVDVRLDPDLERSGWLGQLRIEGSRPLDREVRGERCQDVVEALALITVLRLEGGDAGAAASSTAAGSAPGAAPGAAASGAAAVTGAVGATSPAGAAAASSAAAPATSPAPQPPAAEPAAGASREEQPDSPAPEAPAQSPATSTPTVEPAPVAPAEGATATAEAPESSTASPASPAASVSGAAVAEEPSEPSLRPDEPLTVPAGTERVEVDADSDASGAPSEPFRAQLAPTLALLAGYATVPGHALELTLASELRYGETLRSWTSPIALTVTLGNERVDAADLDFTLLTAQLGLCPPAPLAETWAWLRLCANVRGGAVRVEITPRVPELVDSPASWRPWLAVVPSLEIGVPLSQHWTIRASAELAVQLVRDTFGAALDAGPDPDVLPLYEPEAVSVEGGLGIGYTF